MTPDGAMNLLSQALITAIEVSAPFLIATLVVGLVISVLQVVTQVQEMTLTFVPKLIATGLVCLALGGWMLAVLVEFTQRMFDAAALM